MTTIDPRAAASVGSAAGRPSLADIAWFTTTDHKRIGQLFLGGGVFAFLAAVVVNVVIGVERIDGDNAALDVDAWAQLLSIQRVGLVFGAALPLAAGVSILATPLQLGARALAFPRLALAGLYLWVGGLILSIVSHANNGGFGGGDSNMVDLFLVSVGLMTLAFAAVGTSLLTTVFTVRAPGMTMRRIPFFAWSAAIFALGLVLVMPVLFGTVIYLFVDHRLGSREAFNGNDGIITWAGWAFTQPTTFLFAIPALGVFAELMPVVFRRRTRLRGVMLSGLALVSVATLAGVTQQTLFDVPWRGSYLFIGDADDARNKLDAVVPWSIFHLLPLLGMAVLFGMLIYLGRPRKGVRPNVSTGFVFAFFGYGMLFVGMGGAALEPIDDLGLQNTVFGEGTLVYVVYGIALAVIGGVAHWAPKLFGRTIEVKKAVPLALLGVGGTILAAFPVYIAGFLDQPGVTTLGYGDSDLQIWNIMSLVGHALVALTIIAFIALLGRTLTDDRPAPGDDPWDAHTIEWATTSPAPFENFAEVPMITSAEPLLDRKEANADASGGDS